MPIAQHQSISNEHFTPPEIIEAARKTMGGIDLDPASCKIANDNIVKASYYFTEESNGLQREWKGNVFLNPPGGTIKGKSSQKIWYEKLVEEWKSGRVKQAVFIAFNLEIIRMCPSVLDNPVCIPPNRVRYWSEKYPDQLEQGQWNKSGIWTNSPTHATIISYLPFQGNSLHFRKNFATIGKVKNAIN